MREGVERVVANLHELSGSLLDSELAIRRSTDIENQIQYLEDQMPSISYLIPRQIMEPDSDNMDIDFFDVNRQRTNVSNVFQSLQPNSLSVA